MAEERKFELKNENYIVTSGWMINDLELGGNELTTYAVVYSFSQDGQSWCYASYDYIANWLGCSTKTVQRCLDSLVEKKLVVKETVSNDDGRVNRYKAYRRPKQGEENISLPSDRGQDNLSLSSEEGSGQFVRGVRTICPRGQDNLSVDTIYDNNKDNNKEGANAPAPQKNRRFSKPSITEIAAYCAEKNISIDPQQFYYFYEAKGWKIGNSPMKNWKAAVQTWVKRGNNSYGNSYSGKPNNCGHNNPEGFDEI